MLPLRPAALRCSNRLSRHGVSTTAVWHRNASLTGAISGGVRKAAAALKNAEKFRLREGQLAPWEARDPEKREQAQDNFRKLRKQEFERKRDLEWLRSDTTVQPEPVGWRASEPVSRDRNDQWKDRARGQPRQSSGGTTASWVENRSTQRDWQRPSPEARSTQLRRGSAALSKGMLVDAPQAMPYTEAASEFIYGTFAVLAALQAKRRKFYKLYIWCGEDGSLSDNDDQTTEIVREAKAVKVPVLRVAGNWDKLLDRMSDKRPHNGLVLEAAAIPKLVAKHLEKLESIQSPLAVRLNHMSPTEKADFNLSAGATSIELSCEVRKARRYPFLLWLDKVTDTGNMGAIFRSAYFLGVDAIILPRHGTAPLSAVTIKASAGAAEHVPILTIDNELNFMKESQECGWSFVSSGSSDSKSTLIRHVKEQRPNQALKYRPVVLMMGNEGEGLRPFLQQQADYTLSIAGARTNGPIDSLNVSVAAALLAQRFLSPYLIGSPTDS